MKNHAITQYRDGVLLTGKAATATHADLISQLPLREILIPICADALAAEWRLKNG
ncbi:MAG: hypothetical protein J6Q74_03440 [Clostridia bacterium]|nr:hypothetical protein [Clostridia bacterium]